MNDDKFYIFENVYIALVNNFDEVHSFKHSSSCFAAGIFIINSQYHCNSYYNVSKS